jgi:hypothetical protein
MAVMERVSRGVHLEVMVARGIWRVRVVRWRWFARGSGAAVSGAGSDSEESRRLGRVLGGAFWGRLLAASLGESASFEVRGGRPRPLFCCFGSAWEGPAWFCAWEMATSAREGRPRFG